MIRLHRRISWETMAQEMLYQTSAKIKVQPMKLYGKSVMETVLEGMPTDPADGSLIYNRDLRAIFSWIKESDRWVQI